MRFVIATILTAAALTPASAQYFYPTTANSYWWQGQPVVTETRTVTVRRMPAATGAYGAYAYAPYPGMMERRSLRSGNDVYVNGTYVGSDPDPRIRETLRREAISESSSR